MCNLEPLSPRVTFVEPETSASSKSDGAPSFIINVNKHTAHMLGDIEDVMASAILLATSYAAYFARGQVLTTFDRKAFERFFDSCRAEFVRGSAEEAARLDAEDFEYSDEFLTRDARDLDRLGSIEALVRERQDSVRASRFNEERFNNVFSSVTDAKVLKLLATEGASVPVASNFINNPVAEKPRNLQRKLGKCYSKHVFKLWQKNSALVLKTEDVSPEEHSKLNKSPMHWCVKPMFPPGRMLGDLSNRAEGMSINCPESKLLVEHLYGEMSYPTIEEIVSSWLVYVEANGYELHDMRLWKDDIRSAFNQFNFKPSETYKLAFEFAKGLIMIMMCGFFGWTGAPQVFANFSRGMLEVLRAAVLGCIFIFCDDFIGFSHHLHAATDQESAQSLIVSVFGDNAWAEEKCVPPSLQAEILGWWVDLRTATIRPSDKAIRKLTFTFFSVDVSATYWPLQLCQVLASLSNRYSAALMGMRPFVNPFYEMCAGPQKVQRRKVSPKARFAVEMWRVAIILLFSDKELMSVSLKVMVGHSVGFARFPFITDASWLGVGAVRLDSDKDPSVSLMGVAPFTSYNFPFSVKRSKHQNHREFLGLIVGILMLLRLGIIPTSGAVLHWINDNTAALSWASKDMCKGQASQAAFMLYSAILVKFKLHVVSVEHTAGSSVLMGPVDKLSRRCVPIIFDHNLHVDLNESVAVNSLMSLCDPTKDQDSGSYHESFVRVHDLLDLFLKECQ